MNEKLFFNQINEITDFIKTSSSFTKLTNQRDYFLKRIENLRFSFDHLDKSLLIAILGGTGVGKSTLINALAKGNISPASIIRPVTRNNVFYYHLENNTSTIDHIILPDDKTFIHEINELKDKIIVDTPDIDSVITENRARMLKTLEISELVLCIVTGEKYKNESLFDILRDSVDIRHFIFLFNKIDLGVSSAQLEDFKDQLEAIGIQNPLILKISSKKYDVPEFIFDQTVVQNEFSRLEGLILEKISEKEIREIKKINLENNINHFLNELKATIPAGAEKALSRFKSQFEENYHHFADQVNRFYLEIIFEINKEFLFHYLYSCYVLSFRAILGVYFLIIDKFKSIFYPRYLSAVSHSPDEIFNRLQKQINELKQDKLLESCDQFSTKIQTSFFQLLSEQMVEFKTKPNIEFSEFNQIIFRQARAGLSQVFDKYYYKKYTFGQRATIFLRNVLLNLPLVGILGFSIWKMFQQYFKGDIPSSELFFFHLIVFLLCLVSIHLLITRIWYRFKMRRLFNRLQANFQYILTTMVRDRFYQPLEKILQRIEDDAEFLRKL